MQGGGGAPGVGGKGWGLPGSARDWRSAWLRQRLIVHKLRASHRRPCQGLASNKPSLFQGSHSAGLVHSRRAFSRTPQSACVVSVRHPQVDEWRLSLLLTSAMCTLAGLQLQFLTVLESTYSLSGYSSMTFSPAKRFCDF